MSYSPRYKAGLHRSASMDTFKLRICTEDISRVSHVFTEAARGTVSKTIVTNCVHILQLSNPDLYELAETLTSNGAICKERRLDANDCPVKVQLSWPRTASDIMEYSFHLRKKVAEKTVGKWEEYDSNPIATYLSTFLNPPTTNKEYPDLCNLPDLNETTLLANLKQRFEKENIYTYVGSILIAVNPFKFFPIYNPKYVALYQNKRLGELPPHVFAVADLAYHAMLQKNTNQCIVISGESGSGKTESANLLLHHLSALAHKGSGTHGMEQNIISAGPVLEAFGNAKTVHNNNSSRFGKFIQVNYRKNGSVHGAVVEKYLLEKSRIVSQAANERNYHVFYYLLAGAQGVDKDRMSLTKPSDYFYLNQSSCWEIEGEEDDHEFLRLCQSMDMLGFSNETQHRIFSVLSAVLHLGNIEFQKKAQHIHHESVTVDDMSQLKVISRLLQVPDEMLLEALTKKKTMAGGESVIMPHKLTQAYAARDAMAKCLYAALFDWIVLQINRALLSKQDAEKHSGNSIGVLDIFGFEDFPHNSFEQFCINYANEHLHYYFNQHIFRFEQEEYTKEGIHWENIEFIDNTECLDLFSKRPSGLLYLLDEQCSFPGATDESLLQKFHEQQVGNAYYEEPKLRKHIFSVVHYAGKVNYNIKDFLEKNTDHVRHDIVILLKNSSLTFVRELVGFDPVAVLRWAILRAFFRAVFAFRRAMHFEGRSEKADLQKMVRRGAPKTRLAETRYSSSPRKTGGNRNRAKGAKHLRDMKSLKMLTNKNRLGPRSSKGKTKPPSVSAQFSTSLQKLMETLNAANPFFIRCIKSNSKKAPMEFDEDLVLRQLRYTGMLATVRIRQSGYNYRLTFEEFIQQYNILLPTGLLTSRSDIESFLHSLDLSRSNYQIGTTKVFLREREKLLLDEVLHKSILRRINTIQHWYKAILTRRRFIMMKQAAITLQSNMRMHLAQKRLDELRSTMFAVLTIQRYVRGFLQRLRNKRLQRAAITLQKHARGYLSRKSRGTVSDDDKGDEVDGQVMPSVFVSGAISTIPLVGAGAMGHISEETKLTFDMLRETKPSPRSQRKTHKSLSTSEMPEVREQQIMIKPALSKSVSEESLQHKSHHRRGAPIAREESFSEPPRANDGEVRLIKVPVDPEKANELAPLADDSPESMSPFSRFKNKFRQPQEQSHEIPSQDSDQVVLRVHRKIGEQLSLPGPRDDPVLLTASLRGMPSKWRSTSSLDRAGKANSAGERSSWREGSTFKRSASAFMRNSKKSLRHLLPSGPSKKNKSVGEESDESAGEELHTDITSRVGAGDADHQQMRSRNHKNRKLVKKREEPEQKMKVSRTSEWQYPDSVLVNSSIQLRQFIRFVFDKFTAINKDSQQDSTFDKVFKESLKKIHVELATIPESSLRTVKLRYKDLMIRYEGVLKSQAKQDQLGEDSPMTLAINAFRGFLDEFIKKRDNKELPEVKVKRTKKSENVQTHLKHKFLVSQFSIATYCEFCNKFIWMTEKALSCRDCKYTLHKKCCAKTKYSCPGAPSSSSLKTGKMMGIPLSRLVNETQIVPELVEKLIDAIETKGLYTEGIYRKPGAAAKIRGLIERVNQDLSSIDFCEYQVHVLAAVMKHFLRELPQPVISYDVYDDFLCAAELTEERERVTALYAAIKKLPTINHTLLERIIIHLTKIAQEEPSNKMSANGIAIIFAPSLLRSRRNLTAQESLKHVPKQTLCIETIIQQHLKRMRSAMADMDEIATEAIDTQSRLHQVRASQRARASPQVSRRNFPSTTDEELDQQEIELSKRIATFQQEKEEIVEAMTSLECHMNSSDDDLLLGDSTGDELDDEDLDTHTSHFTRSPSKSSGFPKKRRRSSIDNAHFFTPREFNEPQSEDDPLAYDIPIQNDDDEDLAPLRSSLTAPELKQVGDEIMV